MQTGRQQMIIGLVLGLALAVPGLPAAADPGDSGWGAAQVGDPDYANALKAVKANDFKKAVELLNKALARDSKNADIHNLLGYSERKRGNVDVAFKHYERALALDPNHRGAHEYVGEAYLTVGNVAKAEEHLARLDKLCFLPCGEYKNLKAAIAAYKEKK